MSCSCKAAVLAVLLASCPVYAQQPSRASAETTEATQATQDATAALIEVGSKDGLEVASQFRAEYPEAAEREGIEGRVWIRVQLSETGKVENAQIISGDPSLVDAALDAALKFRFRPFISDGRAIKVVTALPFDFFFRENAASAKPLRILPVAPGKIDESADKKEPPAPEIDEPVAPAPEEKTAVPAETTVTPPEKTDPPEPVKPLPAPPVPKKDAPLPVKPSGGSAQGSLLHQVHPIYPPEARENHIQGLVVLQCVIGKDGIPKDIKPVLGPEELIPAAVEAVKQWVYQPYSLKGVPIEMTTQVTLDFRL